MLHLFPLFSHFYFVISVFLNCEANLLGCGNTNLVFCLKVMYGLFFFQRVVSEEEGSSEEEESDWDDASSEADLSENG